MTLTLFLGGDFTSGTLLLNNGTSRHLRLPAGRRAVLALGAVGWLPPELSQLLAEAIVVLRLALTGIVVRRVSGSASPLAGLWSGFALAGISVVIAALKEILTH